MKIYCAIVGLAQAIVENVGLGQQAVLVDGVGARATRNNMELSALHKQLKLIITYL